MFIQRVDDKDLFNYALVISLFIHSLTLFSLSFSRPSPKRFFKTMEVTYRVTETPKAGKKEFASQTKSLKSDKTKQSLKEMLTKTALPHAFMKENKKVMRSDVMSSKKQTSLLDTAYSRPKVSIPVFKSEKMTNPQYLSYEYKIRHKIRNRAYVLLEQLMTQADFEEGKVYLTFLIGADGVLKDIKIIEEKTAANALLRRVSLMSVQQSSPFSPLPDDKYPEITYNITISYEMAEDE